MTKRLDRFHLDDIRTAFAGKVYAFTPSIKKGWYGLGVAVANEPGYSPIAGFYFAADTYEEARDEARRLNTEVLKLTALDALDIVASSIAAGKVGEAA